MPTLRNVPKTAWRTRHEVRKVYYTFSILFECIGGEGCRKQSRPPWLLVKDGATNIEQPGPFFASGDQATRTDERLTSGRGG
jgi:hypothetical protein